MSQENVEIVATAIGVFNRRDVSALEELSHEDLEIVSVLTAANLGGAFLSGNGGVDELLRGHGRDVGEVAA